MQLQNSVEEQQLLIAAGQEILFANEPKIAGSSKFYLQDLPPQNIYIYGIWICVATSKSQLICKNGPFLQCFASLQQIFEIIQIFKIIQIFREHVNSGNTLTQ